MTESDVRQRVRDLAAKVGGVRALARKLGLSASYVSDVCNGRRAPGPPFLKMLGIRKEVSFAYVRIDGDDR